MKLGCTCAARGTYVMTVKRIIQDCCRDGKTELYFKKQKRETAAAGAQHLGRINNYIQTTVQYRTVE